MRKFSFVLMLTLFAVGMANHAEAQFWKNWFGKKEEKRKPRPHKSVNTPEEPVKAKSFAGKRHEVVYPDSKIKKHYRIDVLVPLYLDELVNGEYVTFKDKVPEKALLGLDFYEGLKMAVDTLSRYSFSIDVYVHDIATFNSSSEQLVNGGKLDSADLIIGAIQSHDIPVIASFAKKMHINFVSAVSPSDGGVKDNQYFTLMQPSLQLHCEAILKEINKKYHSRAVSVLYRTTAKADENAYNIIIKDTSLDIEYQKLLVNTLPTHEKMLPLFDSTKTNVVIVPIIDNAFADSILKDLHNDFPSYKFEVYGMPTWKSIASLHKPDAYPNIGITITAPTYFDASTAMGQYVEGKYKKEYGGRPGDMVYTGYEDMYWYANLLLQNGTIFNKKYTGNNTAPFTRFDISPRWDKDDNIYYNENRHVYLYRYQSGSYIVTQ